MKTAIAKALLLLAIGIVIVMAFTWENTGASPLTVVQVTTTVPKLEVVHATTTVFVPYETVIVEYVDVIRFVDRVVEVEVPVVEYLPIEYRPWVSLNQFQIWLYNNSTALIPGDVPGDDIDCDDYAERLQLRALEQGYAISIALVDQFGSYFGQPVRPPGVPHAGCLVEIAGIYYYVGAYPGKGYTRMIGPRD